MNVISLQSGSNGNCIYVESTDVKLVFDAGISGKQAQLRLSCHNRNLSDVNALLISHDHADHVRSAGIFQRKFGMAMHVTEPTLAAAQQKYALGKLGVVNHFQAGQTIDFGTVQVETIPTPHDGADGVAFVVDDGTHRLGILTDLGHPFPGLRELLESLDAVLIESNYDPHLLETGPYPYYLKRRISGPGGHLSNQEAAELLIGCADKRLKWACLGHLSEQNNTPEAAMETHRQILGGKLNIHLASRYNVSEIMTL